MRLSAANKILISVFLFMFAASMVAMNFGSDTKRREFYRECSANPQADPQKCLTKAFKLYPTGYDKTQSDFEHHSVWEILEG